mmetsp:Transcript_11849/g.35205  ORF Transcript_11849/g.35205 Transcript_11849/m.35205 type:complete len:203 (+) Transcript_11849:1441-2049(+)
MCKPNSSRTFPSLMTFNGATLVTVPLAQASVPLAPAPRPEPGTRTRSWTWKSAWPVASTWPNRPLTLPPSSMTFSGITSTIVPLSHVLLSELRARTRSFSWKAASPVCSTKAKSSSCSLPSRITVNGMSNVTVPFFHASDSERRTRTRPPLSNAASPFSSIWLNKSLRLLPSFVTLRGSFVSTVPCVHASPSSFRTRTRTPL